MQPSRRSFVSHGDRSCLRGSLWLDGTFLRQLPQPVEGPRFAHPPSGEGRLGCFPILEVRERAAVRVGVRVLWGCPCSTPSGKLLGAPGLGWTGRLSFTSGEPGRPRRAAEPWRLPRSPTAVRASVPIKTASALFHAGASVQTAALPSDRCCAFLLGPCSWSLGLSGACMQCGPLGVLGDFGACLCMCEIKEYSCPVSPMPQSNYNPWPAGLHRPSRGPSMKPVPWACSPAHVCHPTRTWNRHTCFGTSSPCWVREGPCGVAVVLAGGRGHRALAGSGCAGTKRPPSGQVVRKES